MAATPEKWEVDDEGFWASTGKAIAYRNLWISIPNLLCGFAVWLYWGMLAKFIQKIHFGNPELFNFLAWNDGVRLEPKDYGALLFTLPAVAGLAGATLRIPNSFMIAICGGRNVTFMTTVLLVLPALGAGIALQNPDVSFFNLIMLAALSGVGGGAFASSMSNISFFFPKKMQGLSLGLNAGIGNAGVSVMQFLLPWIVTFGAFGALGGDGYTFTAGGVEKTMWVQNAGLVWVPILVIFGIAAWFGMNNLPQHKCGPAPGAIGKYLWLTLLGFAGAAAGIAMLLPAWPGVHILIKTFVIVVIAVTVTMLAMKFATPATIKEKLDAQYAIFKNKHNWIMTYLYVMTFGSFIGYAAAFPLLIDNVFVYVQNTTTLADGTVLQAGSTWPNAPTTAHFIWIGAGVGALIRPLGGWLSDKLGGARVTQWDTVVMIGSTIAAGYFVSKAMQSNDPQPYFMPFLLTFILLFATTGIGNGSTFRMIPIIFSKAQAGPVLGWTSAIAAYGAYLIPKIFGISIKGGVPEYALYGFAGYYATCLALNWWYYARKDAEISC